MIVALHPDDLDRTLLRWIGEQRERMRWIAERVTRGPVEEIQAPPVVELRRCAWVLLAAFDGQPPGYVRLVPRGLEIDYDASVATVQDDRLTRLVIAAHEAAVRVEITAGQRTLLIRLSPRAREGDRHDRHPALARAYADCIREWGPCEARPPRDVGAPAIRCCGHTPCGVVYGRRVPVANGVPSPVFGCPCTFCYREGEEAADPATVAGCDHEAAAVDTAQGTFCARCGEGVEA